MSAPEHDDLTDDDAEVVDALPVPSGEGPRSSPPPPHLVREADRQPARTVPVAQAAAVAATGFAAGALTAAVVSGATRRRAVKAASRRQAKTGPLLGTRSFLVDVHLLGARD